MVFTRTTEDWMDWMKEWSEWSRLVNATYVRNCAALFQIRWIFEISKCLNSNPIERWIGLESITRRRTNSCILSAFDVLSSHLSTLHNCCKFSTLIRNVPVHNNNEFRVIDRLNRWAQLRDHSNKVSHLCGISRGNFRTQVQARKCILTRSSHVKHSLVPVLSCVGIMSWIFVLRYSVSLDGRINTLETAPNIESSVYDTHINLRSRTPRQYIRFDDSSAMLVVIQHLLRTPNRVFCSTNFSFSIKR